MAHLTLPRLAFSFLLSSTLVACGGGGSGSPEPELPDNSLGFNVVDSTDLTGLWLISTTIIDPNRALPINNEEPQIAAITVRSSLYISEHNDSTIAVSDNHLSCDTSYSIRQNSLTPIDISANTIALNDGTGAISIYHINTTGELSGSVYDASLSAIGSSTMYKLSNNINAQFGTMNSLFEPEEGSPVTHSFSPNCFQELLLEQEGIDSQEKSISLNITSFAESDQGQIKTAKFTNHLIANDSYIENDIGDGIIARSNRGDIATQKITSTKNTLTLETTTFVEPALPKNSLLTITASFDLTDVK
ncbi:hypothetical protein EDC56_0172 [Sinobacterium caligoides]|uniref:Lipocalin-like protein n=1 Tax=Sinobacterium caligoides TaxID=933926 RepID=A0A3N2DYU9_9GAMM|nr:hypothetical protein [Sinobacterium caligoides]ROS04659.1 hypothetical protein EDC56_0172 [Sinobacterium caligoides]